MFSETPKETSKFILLRGIVEVNFCDKFFTTYKNDGYDYTKLGDGTTAYAIIGYADTVDDTQIKLYGKVMG